MNTTVEIRSPRSLAEYSEAYTLVERVYRQYGYCDSLEAGEFTPSILIAMDKDKMMGSVRVRSAAEQKLPIEHYFGFVSEEICPYRRSETIEICRLASVGGYNLLILKGLMTALAEYCLGSREIEVIYACMKPLLLKTLQRYLHIPAYPLDFEVLEEKVEDNYRGYFLTDPRPVPTKFLVQDIDKYLPFLQQGIEGRIRINLQGFSHRSNFAKKAWPVLEK